MDPPVILSAASTTPGVSSLKESSPGLFWTNLYYTKLCNLSQVVQEENSLTFDELGYPKRLTLGRTGRL
jgi:hypothetical protein